MNLRKYYVIVKALSKLNLQKPRMEQLLLLQFIYAFLEKNRDSHITFSKSNAFLNYIVEPKDLRKAI